MKNFIKFIAVVCGFVFMCGMSSCCSVVDALYGPPYHYHCPPPPPPRHHHHHHHHYRYLVSPESEMSGEYDMAFVETSD